MILVTGAGGKTGRAVIGALAARGVRVRALVHRASQAATVTALGAEEAVAGDALDPAALDRAMTGVRAVYHICPNMHPQEITIGQATIDAARRAGVQHMVYHSVLHPQVESMPHHWHKMRVEEHLFASGLGYTILQPAAYMQNVLAHRSRIAAEGVYPVPYAVQTRLTLVDLDDVGQAAAIVLTEPGHHAATYELAGSEVPSQDEVAAALGRLLGRPVCAVAVPRDEWARQARTAGMGDYQVETLVKMFEYYGRHGFQGNPQVLAWLLGRAPGSFAAFLQREMGPGAESGSGIGGAKDAV